MPQSTLALSIVSSLLLVLLLLLSWALHRLRRNHMDTDGVPALVGRLIRTEDVFGR